MHSDYLCVTKPFPLYPSDVIPVGIEIYVSNQADNRATGDEEEKEKNVPEIGFIFCSFARSLDASCHSLVSVFGGGGAGKKKYPVRFSREDTATCIDVPRALIARDRITATPTAPLVARKTLKPCPGGLAGVRGP